MKKLFKLLIKFIPIIQMIVFFVNNILLYNDIFDYNFIVNYTFGNSFTYTFLFIIISYTFGFCVWHRLIIYGNFTNLLFGFGYNLFNLDFDDLTLLLIYDNISLLFIILAIYSKFNCNGTKR